jgi:hypothetical protein
VQLYPVLFEWFSANHCEEKPITRPMLIENAKHFHSENNITEAYVFAEGWLCNFE